MTSHVQLESPQKIALRKAYCVFWIRAYIIMSLIKAVDRALAICRIKKRLLLEWGRNFKWYHHPQAFHTYRINLSPFTKDFRVWGASIETILFFLGYLQVASWS